MTENDVDMKEKEEKPQENNAASEVGEFPKIREGDWMLKPCDAYWAEYKGCKSISSRFYQNFYYGETLNCSQWKVDYENCEKWRKKDDDIAYDELLASEKKRRWGRLKAHVTNDVWVRRKAPPSDWSEPLPGWIANRDTSTFLSLKQAAIDETGEAPRVDTYIPSCTIL